MTGKILRAILSVAVAVLLASLLTVTAALYGYFSNVQQAQLSDELSLAADAVEQLGIDYLEGLGSERYRLSLIAPDGSVLFDSRAEAELMENHRDREEIAEALLSGNGSSIRRSSTLTEQTIYEALRLSDGSVLRISISRASALTLLLDMLWPLALIAAGAIIVSVWLARKMARRIVQPINSLNLEEPLENNVYEELSPLLHRIHSQQQEIRQQMQTLKRNRDEFEQIIGSMKEALILLDSRDRVISINPAARALFSVNTDCLGEDFLNLERREEMRSALSAAKERGHSSFHTNIRGMEFLFDLSRIDSGSSVQGLVILAFDVTDKVTAENKRREFTANVSHELKTPLQTIMGSAELIENGIVKQEDIPCFAGRIHKEAARLLALIDDIIRLSQLDEQSEMTREPLSLHTLAEEVLETLADAAVQKGISLQLSGAGGQLYGVRRLLFDMIYNLCDNAIKYNDPGGSVKIQIEDSEAAVSLSVRDNGIGIAPEHQERIFERFYRVDKSHSRQSGGTGLGLSIVKHTVQYHQGRIALESTPGKGTVIKVIFDKK